MEELFASGLIGAAVEGGNSVAFDRAEAGGSDSLLGVRATVFGDTGESFMRLLSV